MAKTAWLLGTRHDFHGLGPDWEPGHVRAFVERCASVVSDRHLENVAEEASSESIDSWAGDAFGGHSALGQWCSEKEIRYLAFDPSDAECRHLGIPDSLASRAAELDGDQESAQQIKEARFEGREVEWVRRLVAWNPNSLLVVVGANHVTTLMNRLAAAGWQVSVVDPNWTPPAP